MDQKLLTILKKLPKERYRELTESLGKVFDAKKIRDGLAQEGVEIDNDQAAYLETVLKKESDMELSEDQIAMIAGGKGDGCV